MKMLAITIVSSSLLASGFSPVEQAQAPSSNTAQTVEVRRNGSQPSTRGSAENFTGSVRITPLFEGRAPGARVAFEPGARTTWPTHPLGQTLIVTAGSGYVQQWGKSIQEIRPGDVVQISAGSETLARSYSHHSDDAHRPSPNSLTARMWTGWNRSATTNIAIDLCVQNFWESRCTFLAPRHGNSS